LDAVRLIKIAKQVVSLSKNRSFHCFQDRMTGVFLLGVIISVLGFQACQKPKPEQLKTIPASKLSIFAIQKIRSSGFEAAVIKEFARQNNTTLAITLFHDLSALLDSLYSKSSREKVDIVIGLNSAFTMNDSLLTTFDAVPEVSLSEINHEIPRDPGQRLIPYATANLAFIYNTKVIAEPPRSFGELQDSRFFSQLGVCDPRKDGLGRSSLYWSVSLFGEKGWTSFWSSLRKNITKIYNTDEETITAVRKGECGIILGWHTIPSWIAEIYPSENYIRSVIPEEGSFQYVESAALCRNAPDRVTAVKFLNYLISSTAQQFVMFKLAMLPVNGRTALSGNFAKLPLSVYTLNYRLDKNTALSNIDSWIETWNKQVQRMTGFL
jgi:thiamine transport system substrate-binding protein